MRSDKRHGNTDKKKRGAKIRLRIFLGMMLLTAAALAILWLFQEVFLDDMYKKIKQNSIKMVSEIIVSNIDDPGIAKLAEACAVEHDMCISVWKTNERAVEYVVAQKCLNNSCRVHSAGIIGANSFYRQALNSENGYMEYFGISTDKTTYYIPIGRDPRLDGEFFSSMDGAYESVVFAKTVRSKTTGESYLIMLGTVITPLVSVVQSIKIVFMIIALVMVILSIVISAALSRYMLKPIKDINEKAKLLAAGKYNVHFDETAYREVVQLAETLNYAAGELASLETTRNEIIANVSHDLRTPLTLISGYAEMIRDFPNEDNGESLQTIIDEVEHMTLLVNDMTDASRYSAGVESLRPTEFSLTAITREICDRLSRLNDPDGYRVEFIYDSEAEIYADELKITQVLYNFINNAVTHTGDDKRVEVVQKTFVQGKEHYAKISITDSGKGVRKENVKAIWDRYIKIDKTYKRAHNGSGLGLYIVKSILELHGMSYGVVPVEEMPDEKGCTFWFEAKLISKKDSSAREQSERIN